MLMEHDAFPGQKCVVPDRAVPSQMERGWRPVNEAAVAVDELVAEMRAAEPAVKDDAKP